MDRTWTVADHLSGVPAEHADLFRRVEALVLELGDVRTTVSRTLVGFAGPRRGFAGARPTRRGVDGYFDVMYRVEDDPRVRSVTPYQRNLFVHRFRLTGPEDVDATFAGWLADAYRVGCGDHLAR